MRGPQKQNFYPTNRIAALEAPHMRGPQKQNCYPTSRITTKEHLAHLAHLARWPLREFRMRHGRASAQACLPPGSSQPAASCLPPGSRQARIYAGKVQPYRQGSTGPKFTRAGSSHADRVQSGAQLPGQGPVMRAGPSQAGTRHAITRAGSSHAGRVQPGRC